MIPYKRWENFSLINNDVITTSILLGCKFIDVCRKNKNVFLILIEINMIITYENITKFSGYDSQSNIFYFKKNDEKDNNERKNRSVIIFFILF